MASDDKNAEIAHFILSCLSCSREALSIDFNEACKKNGMTLARNCQQKFKKLIESTGKYSLVNGKVVDIDPDGAPAVKNPSSGRGKKGGPAAASSPAGGRGRKRKGPDDEGDDSADNDATPSKRTKATPKRSAAKKAASKVKDEAEEEAELDTVEEDDGAAGVDDDDGADGKNDGHNMD